MSTSLTPTRTPHKMEPGDPARLDLSRIAQDLQIRKVQVESVVQLLDEDNTVPFITRYRKERTGGLDEDLIRAIKARVEHLRALAERKQTILASIESQGKLTDELRHAIVAADSPKRLEDLYLPYKPKKRSLASEARDRGLGPLAEAIWNRDPAVANLGEVVTSMVNPEKGLTTPDDVIQGVGHILSETISEQADIRAGIRFFLWDHGKLLTTKSDKVKEGEGLDYKDYFEFSEAIHTVPPHRILAINRGEKENVLSRKLEFDAPFVQSIALDKLPLNDHPHAELLRRCAEDALSRLLLPSLEREIFRELKDRALDHAVEVFARNLRSLLLAPPLRGKRVLAIDPAFRTGCKLAVLDETGNLLEDTIVYPHPPQRKRAEAMIKIEELIRRHQVTVIALGNGTASRETEDVIAELLTKFTSPPAPTPTETPAPPPPPPVVETPPVAESPPETPPVAEAAPETPPATEATAAPTPPAEPPPDPAAVLIGLPPPPADLAYIIVNEAGASDYSTTEIAKEEFPTFDPTLRSSISIGRRLQDPLSELVKIDPQHVGVGQYQHDVNTKQLKEALDGVIESCVNQVGVDLNTASVPLLRYVSGLNQLTATNLVEHRKANGPFRRREQITQVYGVGEKTFTQAAGFLKVSGGDEPLDLTWIHPESYAVARQVLQELGYGPEVLTDRERSNELREKLKALSPDEVAQRLNVGGPTCKDILDALARPGRDPREDLPPPIFKKGVLKLEDLAPGMELKGTVLNVVDFGAFVDIGLKDSGLVHISRMANRYVKSPYDVVAVGDVVTVWVMEVDQERRRVRLTMIQPGTERKPGERRGPPPRGEGRPQGEPRPQGEGRPQGDRPPPRRNEGRPQGDRPRGDRPPPREGGARPQGGDRPPPRPARSLPPRGMSAKQMQQRGQRGPQQAPQQGGPAEGQAVPAETGSAQGAKPRELPPRKPKRQAPRPKLSKAALAGQESLGTFAELAVFWEAAGKPKEAPAPPPAETPPVETPPVEAAAEPAGEQGTPPT